MALWRVTLFFECRKFGWSETYFRVNASEVFADVEAAASVLADARRKLVASPASLPLYRISDDLVQRDSFLQEVSPSVGSWPGGTTADIPNTCILTRLQFGRLYRRNLFLRGQPDGMVIDGGELALSAEFHTKFDQFKTLLLQPNGWGIRVIDTGNPKLPIHTIVRNVGDPHQAVVTTFDAINLAVGNYVQVGGRMGSPGYRGTWQVIAAPNPTTFTIRNEREFPETPELPFGYARKYAITSWPINEVTIVRATHRITGRPFGSPVGRRRARRVA